jgi:serine/threonine protein kinase
MSAPLECPAVESWHTLLGADLPPEQWQRYERHLESCPACQERLDRAGESGDTLRQMGRELGDPTQVPDEPALMQVLDRLREGMDAAAPLEEADLYFLRPSDRPGVLGTLGGYEVREVVGQGGMGVVLKAFEPALNRLVAIKVMAAALAGSATARRRFTREAQAAAAVCHDHIVTVHGVQEIDGLPCLMMQYVAGESLQQRIDRTGPLEVMDAVRIGMQAASGLAAAHAQGLIHRDVKPANLLLEDGLARVKITDFGLARMADDVQLTQSGVVAGTPEYMAPEQARGEPADHRSDLFSLGSVLYAMCTGRPPFRGETAVAVLRRVSDEEPAPVRALNPDVPAWLEQLIARLMAKDRADRFQTAEEVASLLEGYLAHLRQPATAPAPVLPPSPPRQGSSPLRFLPSVSRRQYVLLALTLALPTSLLALGALLLEQEPAESPDHVLARLEKLGARIQRDENRPGRPVVGLVFKDTPPESVASASSAASKVTDADLKNLAVFRQLRRLDLTDARNVTDAALKGLTPLGQLRELTVGRTAVSDAGLKDVAALKQLRGLGLEETQVTDAGVRHIAGLTQLVYLNLGGTKVTDAGLKELAPLTELRVLCLYETGVTDAGMKNLLPFTRLQKLLIADTAVTDAGRKELAPLQRLTEVDWETSVSEDFRREGGPPALGSRPAGNLPADGPRGWAVAAGLVILVVALSAAGVWWAVRQKRRAGKEASAPAAPVIAVQCPGCNRKLKVRADLAGKKVKCPGCGQGVPVPGAALPQP